MQIKKLEKALRDASQKYYDDGTSPMSDSQFDTKLRELKELDPNNSFLREIGAPVTNIPLAKIPHKIAMGSLSNLFTEEELSTWLKSKRPNIDFVVQPKLDGISVELVYENGTLIKAISRGDGSIGEDITHTIKRAEGMPRKIGEKGGVSVRCEAIIPISVWKNNLADITANPRNAVAGIARRKDSKNSNLISCIAFDVLSENTDWETEEEKISWLIESGFKAVDSNIVSGPRIMAAIESMEKARDGLPYEIDGAVIKVNSLEYQGKLGENAGRPFWSRSYKFTARSGHTVLKGVTWSVGTQGTITPVAKVDPVHIGGVTVTNVSLHNISEVERLGVTVGDEVEVVRAGDVVPHIIRVVKGCEGPKITINRCPACGSHTVRRGPFMMCGQGRGCPEARRRKVLAWISKRNIQFLGEKTLDKLISEKVVATIRDLYALNVKLMAKSGVGGVMAKKILGEIEKSRTVTVSDLIGSLSIDMLGRREASNLVEKGLRTIGNFLSIYSDEMAMFEGFQRTKATRICRGIRDAKEEIVRLADVLNVQTKKEHVVIDNCEKKSVCFTGRMMSKRADIEEAATEAGFVVKKGVAKGLDYLVVADPSIVSSKTKKAKTLNVEIITEQEFIERLKE